MSKRTITTREAIDFTYDGGTSGKAKSLEDFMHALGYKRIPKGASSVFIHSTEYSDLAIHIEANDDDFLEATATSSKTERYKERIFKHLKRIFPESKMIVTWYSGYEYHRRDYLNGERITNV